MLHRFDLVESFSSFFYGFGTNHFAELIDSAGAEEHMLGTAKTDTLRAEIRRALRVCGGIRVRSHAEFFIFIGKLHNASEITAVGIDGNGFDYTVVNLAGRTVEREFVAFVENLSAEFEVFRLRAF